VIFLGEVNKAPGSLYEAEAAAEPILFTMEPAVLARLEEHDHALFEYEPVAELERALIAT
jgi:hypothetical protein